MRTTFAAVAALVLLASCTPRPLQLRRVVLYQNGVGHFEHSGKVKKKKLRFFVKDYEVDDVLKTLTVVSKEGVTLTPTVNTVTVEQPPVPGTKPGEEVGEAVKTGARRAIDVWLSGAAGTEVSVSYAVPTPAWKATYRIVLPEVGKEKALLQGWASLQNTSDEDWNDVELTLATGAPFTYAIDLHSPEFVARPNLKGKLIKPSAVGAVGSSRALPGDADGDGIKDATDQCPADAEDKDGFEDSDGCPELDNDKDRILDADDQCPTDAEVYNGLDDEDGCPDRGRIVVTETRIEVLDKIYFEANSAVLLPRSKPIADAIVATLAGNLDIALIEIQGHAADNERNSAKLSRDRADAVSAYLVQNGIAARRLRPNPYGKTSPVDRKKTANARAKNRRVEFLILKRGEEKPNVTVNQPAVVRARKDRSATVAKATDVAGMVQYKLPVKVSIPHGESTLVPIVNRYVSGSAIYLFRPDGNAPGSDRHPFRAARVVNSGGVELPPGPVAIFADGSFAGEGLIDKLFAGETAYVPYATDSSTTVTSRSKERLRPARILAIANGVARVEDDRIRTTHYEIVSGKKAPHAIYLHHTSYSGYEPVNAPQGTEKTPTGRLLRLPIRAGRSSVFDFEEKRAEERTIALSRWSSGSLEEYARGTELPPGIASALGKVALLRKKLQVIDRDQDEANKKRYRLISRASQIRANLIAIGKNAPKLKRKLLAELAKNDKVAQGLLAEVAKKDEARAKASALLLEALDSLAWNPNKK